MCTHMKLFTKLASLSVGLAMAVGVGVAVSQKADEVKADDLTYKLTINSNDFNTTSYAANNNEKTSNAVCTTDSTKTYQVKWTSYQVMKNSNNMQWQKSKGYIYNSTDLGTISNVTVTSSAGSFTTYYGTSEQPSSGSSGSGKGFFKTFVGSATGTSSQVEITFTISGGGGETTKYTVTYSAGENGTGSKVYNDVPEGNYTLLSFNELSTVNADSGYRFKNYTVGGVDKNPGDSITLSDNTTITVNFEVKPLGAEYNFVTNFATYSTAAGSYEGTDWGGYSARTVTASMLGAEYDATITFSNVSKQASTINDRPVIAAKCNTSSTMTFTLASSVSSSYTISTVDVKFAQWGTKVLNASLYKGTTVSGTALDSFNSSSSPRDLETSNLNGDSFIVDFVSKDSTGTTNYQLGITSISIGLTAKAAFGTVDHISVTSFPNTIYHVGEKYDSTGLKVTAYDGADEETANFKDVTSEAKTRFTSGIYTFVDDDVPSVDMWVEYTENEETFYAEDITMHVFALAQYELVTSAPTDWSGSYLIVGTNSEEKLGAFNGSLSMLDATSNYKVVSADEDNVVETGQELEFTISAISGGYSIRAHNGKYIGWDSGSGNGLTASDTPLVNTISYADSAVTIAGAGGRQLTLNSDTAANRFRYYQSGTVQLYKLVTSSEADDYAQTFLSAFTCDASGEEAPTFVIKEGETYWSWNLLKQAYNALSSNSKEMFRLGVPSETGDNIAQALARYDLVVAKYEWENFMSRDIASLNQAGDMTNVTSDSSSYLVIIIVIIASIALDTIVIAHKKRKFKK